MKVLNGTNQALFIGATIGLFVVGLLGQLLCDHMGYGIGVGWYLLAMLVFLAMCTVMYSVTRFLERPGILFRILSWGLGLIVVTWAGIVLLQVVVSAKDDYCLYGNGWCLQGIHITEEYNYINRLTHWFGAGEPYYQYSDVQATPLTDTEAGWTQEPCLSASMERAKAESVFWDYRGTTILSVVSYRYGRWYLVLYSLVMIVWAINAICLVLKQTGVVRRLFLSVALLPLLICGCGSIFSALGFFYLYFGPLFCLPYFWQECVLVQFLFLSLLIGLCLPRR